MTPEQVLGWYIRELRLSHGWTLDDLSKKSGVARSSLGLIETGGRSFSIRSLCKVANAFNLSAGTILKESGYQKLVSNY